jgi:Flp pilus assembly protein TadG
LRRLLDLVGRATRDERGYVLAEFALATVVLTTLVFGIIDFGRALYTYHLVANAARIGARYAAVRSSCTTPCTPTTTAGVLTAVNNLSPGLNASTTACPPTSGKGCVATTWSAPSYGVNGNCTTSPYTAPGCLVTVTVMYAYKFFIPGLPAPTMSSSSQMIVSQ